MLRDLVDVRKPKRRVPFREKLMWTCIVIGLFFIMGEISPIGLIPKDIYGDIYTYGSMDMYYRAKTIGTTSIISFGISSILTTWVIILLAFGLLTFLGRDIDLLKPTDKVLFRITQYILIFLISLLAGFGIASYMHLNIIWITIVAVQMAIGSILLVLMAELVSKWGIGTGIGVFIVGATFQGIFVAIFNPLILTGRSAGIIPTFLYRLVSGYLDFTLLWPVVATIIGFAIVIVFLVMVLSILQKDSKQFEGETGTPYPLRLLYTSGIIVLLAATLLGIIQSIFQVFASIVGVDIYNPPLNITFFQNIVYGIGRHITLGELRGVLNPANIIQLTNPHIILHLIIYTFMFSVLCVLSGMLFSKFWTRTDFGSEQSHVVEIINQHTQQIIVVSFIAGLFSVAIDLVGALGGGTGILVSVGILYVIYSKIQEEKSKEMAGLTVVLGTIAIGFMSFIIFLISQIMSGIY